MDPNDKHRLEGFRALIASDKSGSYLLEDTDSTFRPWQELSAEGKLHFIAWAAAMYEVPFVQFAETVRDFAGKGETLTEAALRTVLEYKRELHALAELLPDDGRTESTPLVERFRELLDYQPADRAGLMAHDMAENAKTTLESFSDEFERLARTPEQKTLVSNFKEFVGEVTDASMKRTFDKLLTRYATLGRGRTKDMDMER